MNFDFDDDQKEFRSTIRRFVDQRTPITETRRLMTSELPYEPKAWRQASEQLGLPGLIVDEEWGGQGFSFLEAIIACEELGRALAGLPYLSTLSAIMAIKDAGSSTQLKELLPQLASGERTATLATAEPGGSWGASGIDMIAEFDGTGEVTLHGSKSYVLDGHTADVIVVAARQRETSDDDGIVLAVVEADAPGVTRRLLSALDQTRRVARLDFDGVRGRLLERGQWSTLARTLDRLKVALSAEMIGGAQRCLERAVEYANERHQFGRPIGSFQAIKHKCADILLEVESAKAAVYYAAWAASEDNDELSVVAPLAKAYALQSYFFAASESLHVHGGIGFTWEDDSHLYFKRAKASELLYGDASTNLELLATRLDL